MHNAVTNYVHFMCTALVKFRQTGAIVPSQRFLIDRMIAPVPESYSGRIIELGAGKVLAGINGRVQMIPDSAEHLLSEMDRRGMGKVDFVLSGIPLGNLHRDRVTAIIDAVSRALVPGGMYIQFQYSLMDRKRIRARFQTLRTAPVFLNIPPAVVYYAQK